MLSLGFYSSPPVAGNGGTGNVVCLMLSPQVVELGVQEPYKRWLRFDDGITGVVDLSESAGSAAFSPHGLMRTFGALHT